MKYQQIKQKVYDTVLKAQAAGLVRLSAGNISSRTEDGLAAITPSGIVYDELKVEEISIVTLDGEVVEGPKPSSETPLHTGIYRKMPEVQAICHTHSPYAITFSMIKEEIPMVNLELMVCGGTLPVAPWSSPGAQGTGDIVVDLLNKQPGLKVVILRQHGLVAVGQSLKNAFELAYDAEVGLLTYYRALQIGDPKPLTKAQLDEIAAIYSK